jgi:hypothetical protein
MFTPSVRSRLALASLSLILANAAHAGSRLDDWATLKNERHGFTIAYPVDVFEQKAAPTADEGRVLVSKDGKAKLLVGAFSNEDDSSLDQYRQFLLDGQWKGAAIDYAPVRKKWFVLSGPRDGQIFYERVSFTCGGKLINSWAMVYPEVDRKLYDRVLEAVAKTYLPGAGHEGNCD